MSEEQKFYHRGVFYDSFEEFEKSVARFAFSQVSEESIKDMLEPFAKTILCNINIRNIKIDNSHLMPIIEEAMMLVLEKIFKKKGEQLTYPLWEKYFKLKDQQCNFCHKKIDISKISFTYCHECKEIFCSNWNSTCWKSHSKETTHGECSSILDPSYKVNLRNKDK